MMKPIVSVLVLALMLTLAGCVSTPQGPKLTPEATDTIDVVAGEAEDAITAVGGWVATVPYGQLALGLVLGGIAAWRKAKPYVTATNEIVAGIGKPDEALAKRLDGAESSRTKALVAKLKNGLK